MRRGWALVAFFALVASALAVDGQQVRDTVTWFDGAQHAPLAVHVTSPYLGVDPPTLVPLAVKLASQNATGLRLEGSVVHRLPNGTEEELVRLDRTVAPYARETIAVNVWINQTGLHNVAFVSRGAFSVDRTAAEIRGLPPLDVRLETPAAGDALVVIPGREALVRVNLTSHSGTPFRDLTFQLDWGQGSASARLALLAPGAARTVEVVLPSVLPASGALEYLGKDETEARLEFNGTMGTQTLPSQPLFATDSFPPRPIVLPVYLANRPSLFVDAEPGTLGKPSEYRLLLVNTGERALSRSVQVRFEKSGFPSLTQTETLPVVAPAGGVGEASALWVPDASGGWSLVATGPGLSENRASANVAGPLTLSSVQRLDPFLRRGEVVLLSFDLAAHTEPVRVLGFGMALERVPYTGPVSASDFLDLEHPSGTVFLRANETRPFNLTMTPRASGWWSLGLVVETDRGLVVADDFADLEVRGHPGARWLLFVPTGAFFAGLVGHVVWRRWGAA